MPFVYWLIENMTILLQYNFCTPLINKQKAPSSLDLQCIGIVEHEK